MKVCAYWSVNSNVAMDVCKSTTCIFNLWLLM